MKMTHEVYPCVFRNYNHKGQRAMKFYPLSHKVVGHVNEEPLQERLSQLRMNSRALSHLDRVVASDRREYVLLPSLAVPLGSTSGQLTKREHSALLTQAIELNIHCPDLEARDQLFDKTTKYVRVYIDNLEAMVEFNRLHRVVDDQEECHDSIKSFWGTKKVDRYFEEAFECVTQTPEFTKTIEFLQNLRLEQSSAVITKQSHSSREFEINGVVISPPARPSLPVEIVEAGVPPQVLNDLRKFSDRPKFLSLIHKIFKNRPKGAKYPYEFRPLKRGNYLAVKSKQSS